MNRFQRAKQPTFKGLVLALGAALGLGMAVTAPQVAIAADTSAVLEIRKTASETELKPGEFMEYRIEVGCSTITDLGCRGATLSDLIPAEFEIVPGSVTVTQATASPAVIDGNQITIEFIDDLGDGTIGLIENTNAVITIQVKLREDLPFGANGVPIVNTAVATAENAEEASDLVEVTPIVELALLTKVDKSYSPDIAQAAPGATTQLTVTGSNASNASVDSLQFTDPVDPAATPNPFDLLAINGVADLTFPEGAADTATIEYFIDGDWVPFQVQSSDLPHAPPGNAKGVRVTFSAASGERIPVNAGGGFVLDLEQRAGVADLEETTTVNNTVSSEVALDEATAAAKNSADYTLITEPISVKATKAFDPKTLILGQQTTVTLTGENTSLTDLDSLAIREPATGSFAEELDFTGFMGSVQFPAAATSGAIELVYYDDSNNQLTTTLQLTDGAPYPALPADFARLDHFVATFEGPITPGGSTTIQLTAEANELAFDEDGNNKAPVDNVVGVTGTKAGEDDATDTDTDTVDFEEKKIEIVTEKKLSPGEIWGYAGEGVLVQLPTTVVKPGSNVPATEIIVSDPALSDPADPNSAPADAGFWDAFTPEAITNTDVPAGATMTVRYWNTATNEWLDVPGFVGLSGTVNTALPANILDNIGGLQFVFESQTPGFEPHKVGEFNVNPSFTAKLNETLPVGADPVNITNCASSLGAVDDGQGNVIAEDASDAPACDEITINAPTPGEYDLFSKSWVGNPAQVVQRSGDLATTQLNWSTENLTFGQMTIGDTRLGEAADAGPTDPVAQTTFEAFDLHTVKAVTTDPGFVKGWDRITAIDLWIGGAWVPAANATGLPYSKTMSNIALTAAERSSATAVRVVFEENPVGRTGAGAPPVGSGLTKSTGPDRKVELTWQVRDTRRSAPNVAVIASEIYNVAGNEGDVKNWGSATGEQPTGNLMHDQDNDDITIVPRPLGVTVTKGWSGGPLGVPPEDVPQSSFPTSRVTISAKNTSQQKVDQLTIIDPSDGGVSPFEIFNLYKIVSAPNAVQGGDPAKTRLFLTDINDTVIGGAAGLTPDQAIALMPAALQDVVKVELRHEGRIVSGAAATLQLDLQLRKTHRSTPGTTVSIVDGPVKNETTATVTDLAGLVQERSVDNENSAQIGLDVFTMDVSTQKSFTPDTQRVQWLPDEPQHFLEEWSPIRMDLSARPTGTARADKIVVTDSGENRVTGTPSARSFWNSYRFMGFTDNTLKVATPVNRVQAEVLYGDFTAGLPDNGLDFTSDTSTPAGDGWVAGTAAPVAVSGGQITNAAATLLADIPAADYDLIRGIRFTFERVDGSGNNISFENPANPEVKIALQVKRRAYLVSNPPTLDAVTGQLVLGTGVSVPASTSPTPAPGEAASASGGVFTNTVDAVTESFAKFPVAGSTELLPATASAEDTAQVFYRASGVTVAVQKTPVGAQQPGAVIPFKLKTTNTAGRSVVASDNEELGIADLVITDTFPVVNGKPQLIFDPDMEEAKRFSFALENRMAPDRSVMPVNPSLVTVTYLDQLGAEITDDSEPFGVRFSFANARVLYPGEAYTVTVNMMFRPGVLAGSDNALTNSYEVSSDETFGGCNFKVHAPGDEVPTCGTSTEIYPNESGALRGKKYVRANDNELGIADLPNPKAGRECLPFFGDADTGFYANNCVPITKPLGVETWREEMQNTGTVALDKVVTIDSLPKVNDQGAIVTLPRKSEWQPLWIGDTTLVTAIDADGHDYRSDVTFEQFYSSTEGAVCTADLRPTGAQCVDVWTPLDDTVDPAMVRHVKTVFDFSAAMLEPGQRFAYTFETRTPASAPKMTADTVAWNSIAVGARTEPINGRAATSVLPTEGLRVGVALATGPLAVQKLVAGEGASFAPETFDVQLLCVVPAREGAAAVSLDPITVTVEADNPVALTEQLPWGANCEVAEVPGVNGETSSEAGAAAVVARDSDPLPVLELTNQYDLGSFVVNKDVYGAVDQDGNTIDYGTFTLSAACTFLGNDISLAVDEADLTDGGLGWLVDQLPVGAECTLTETETQGGVGELTVDDQPVAQNPDDSWTFTITADQPDIAFVLTNVFPLGSIAIEKLVEGDGAQAIVADTTFTFSVLCTFRGNTVWDDEVSLTKAEAIAGTQRLIEQLPLGASCQVAESETGGATATTVTPDTSDAGVVITSDEVPLSFTAVNTYDAGALQITKEITGAGAELYGAGAFEVSLECTLSGNPINVPGGQTRALESATGYLADYTGLPVGAACDLTETITGGATSSEIVTSEGAPVTESVIIGAGDSSGLKVINTFDLGEVDVTKKIEGAGAKLGADKVFTVALACTIDKDGTITPIAILGDAERELSKAAGLTATYDQLPVGAICELRETKNGGAESTTITPNSGDGAVGTVQVAAGDHAKITVVNTFAKPAPPTGVGSSNADGTDNANGTGNANGPARANTGGLPTTGGSSPLWWGIGGAGLLIIGAGLLIFRARTREPKE